MMDVNCFASLPLSSYTVHSSDCLGWIMAAANVVMALLLVSVTFVRINGGFRAFGIVLSVLCFACSVVVFVLHRCVFVYALSAMSCLMFVMLMVVFAGKGKPSSLVGSSGCYVVNEANSAFTFALYDEQKRCLAKSAQSYSDLTAVKNAIEACRTSARAARICDETAKLVQEVDYPKFLVEKQGKKCLFKFVLQEGVVSVISAEYSSPQACRRAMHRILACIASTKTYVRNGKK